MNVALERPRADGSILLVSRSDAGLAELLPEVAPVVEAGSARDALRALLRTDVSLVVMDLDLPDMGGFDLAALIRQRERARETPILFVVPAEKMYDGIDRALAVGGPVDFLAKPLIPTVVRARAAVMLRLQRQKEALRTQEKRIEETRELQHELALADLRLGAERRFRSLAELLPQIVWTATAGGRIDWLNRRWFEYSGRPASRSGEGWLAIVHHEDREACVAAWRHSVETGDVFRLECRLARTDGSWLWHLCQACAETDDRNGVVSWIGTCTDVDEQRRGREFLAQSVRMRDEFLSIASHELRTPLTSMRVQLDLLLRRRKMELSGELESKLEVVDRQVHRLTKLVDQLLDVTRIAEGRLALEREEVDLGGLATELASLFEQEAARAGVELRVDVESVVGCWDRAKLEQVIANLIANAIKFGNGRPVDVRVRRRGEGARLVVCDRGIGIEPKDARRIFQRFERAASSRSFGGLGLGLFIASQLVAAHHGRIRVRSTPGAGATFVVDLPIAG